MKLEKDYDVALTVNNYGINVYMARIPDPEVAAVIVTLNQNPGIELPEGRQTVGPVFGELPCTKAPPTQRLYYWVEIFPVYEVKKVAEAIANELRYEHGLTVRVIHDFPDDNSFDKSIIFSPV